MITTVASVEGGEPTETLTEIESTNLRCGSPLSLSGSKGVGVLDLHHALWEVDTSFD
jgi:hypothetical protein